MKTAFTYLYLPVVYECGSGTMDIGNVLSVEKFMEIVDVAKPVVVSGLSITTPDMIVDNLTIMFFPSHVSTIMGKTPALLSTTISGISLYIQPYLDSHSVYIDIFG